jgi:hypothetical protein
MEQIPYPEDNSLSANQKIPALYEKLMFVTITDFRRTYKFLTYALFNTP